MSRRPVRRLHVASRGPLCPSAVLSTLSGHAIPGAEVTDPAAGRHDRVVRVGGRLVRISVRPRPDGVVVEHDADDDAAIERHVRWWFDLDTDVDDVDRRLGADPLFAAQVRDRPGVRVTRYADGFEAAIMTVVGQQVSLAAGRTFGGKLVAAYSTGRAGGLRPFPTPRRLAAEPVERLRATLGITGARSRTVHALAELFADGFTLTADSDPADARRVLCDLPGIGPWTAGYLSVRAMGDADAFPAGDAVLRRALGGLPTAAAEARAVEWSPYRSYASMRLWAMAA